MSGRRAKAERRAVDAIRHVVEQQVASAHSIQAMWRLYRASRPEFATMEEEYAQVFCDVFYSGAAAMFELAMRVAPAAVSEEAGAQMLQRLEDELRAHAQGVGVA